MNPRTVSLLVVAVAIVAVALLISGEAAKQVAGDSLETLAAEWLEGNSEQAERYAIHVLKQGSNDLPQAPKCERIMCFPDSIAFVLDTGFKAARGVCFAPTGVPPGLGLSEEPPVRWIHLHGTWYAWVAD